MHILLLLGCAPTGPATLDEPAWLADLQAHRPELMTQHEGSIRDPAWQALVIRPQYRAELLATDTATYETLVAREYTAAQRVRDASWAQALRDAAATFVPTVDVSRAGYDIHAYVGYRVGPPFGPDGDGLVYKVFFEFVDFERSLSPDRYAGFVSRLESAGFRGDSKIDLRPGQARFQYNNLIVHTSSIAMARCAEAVGLATFGDEVLHVARGIDAPVDGRPTNWHQFLLTGRYDALSATVKDFVAYRTPIGVPSSCPTR